MAKKIDPPKVQGRNQGQGQDPGDSGRFREEVPPGGLSGMFTYDPPTKAPDRKNPADQERFKDFLGRLLDGDDDVPEGVQRLVEAKDFDTIWAIWSAAIRE